MIRRLIINDFKSNKLITISTSIFMAVTAMMLGLSVFLFATLYSSVTSLMIKAKTPDFLQMHTGEISETEICEFAERRSDVEEMQICGFLNLENGQISIGNKSFDNNMQDNGLFIQSDKFDNLLDSDNNVIEVSPGDVYVPVAYKNEYDIKPGDEMHIGEEKLRVAGFMRDSQMNSMMASSKRFLVNEVDYERLRYLGSEEYLIEFKLKKDCDIGSFSTAYKDAGLPGNGPMVTFQLIKLMNALSDGIMIIVILLVAFVVLYISIMCIRYIILTQLEKDKREIGMLKAVGIARQDIRRLYISKYLLLSMIGCLVGIVLARIIAVPLGSNMKELYGEPDNTLLIYILMFAGAFLAEAIILLSVRRTLRKTEKISTVAALSGRNESGRRNFWRPIAILVMAVVFMMMVPDSMKKTLADPEFVRYMGIGNSQIRIDVRQSQDIEGVSDGLYNRIVDDSHVDKCCIMRTGSYNVSLPDGKAYNLILENGNHSIFPVNYTEGTFPQNEEEIALSILSSEECGLGVGDTITIYKKTSDGELKQSKCVICGIYSDITNGGKTAKGCINDDTAVIWSVMYVSLKENVSPDKWIAKYMGEGTSANENIKIAEISEYIEGMYGQTISGIGNASLMTKLVASGVIIVVILLLMRLLIWKERSESSLKKALGLTTVAIRIDYMKKLFRYLIIGIILGILSGLIFGPRLVGALLGFMGAKGFEFTLNPVSTFVVVPVITFLSAGLAAVVSLKEIKSIKAFECLNTRQ